METPRLHPLPHVDPHRWADRRRTAPIEEVVITNTLPVPDDAAALPNLVVLSIANILADALKAIFTDDSVSDIFMGENA